MESFLDSLCDSVIVGCWRFLSSPPSGRGGRVADGVGNCRVFCLVDFDFFAVLCVTHPALRAPLPEGGDGYAGGCGGERGNHWQSAGLSDTHCSFSPMSEPQMGLLPSIKYAMALILTLL